MKWLVEVLLWAWVVLLIACTLAIIGLVLALAFAGIRALL